MKINSLQELEELIKICRKTHVESITVDGIQLNLAEQPKRKRKLKSEEKEVETESDFTEEQVLMWSAQGPI